MNSFSASPFTARDGIAGASTRVGVGIGFGIGTGGRRETFCTTTINDNIASVPAPTAIGTSQRLRFGRGQPTFHLPPGLGGLKTGLQQVLLTAKLGRAASALPSWRSSSST